MSNLSFVHLGDGITVYDTERIENGDHKIVAHISSTRRVSYYDKVSDIDKSKIRLYVATQNPKISQSQNEYVFDNKV